MRSLDGGRLRGPSAEKFGGLFGRWDEVVGPDVARHVQPVRLDDRHLVVAVADPAWATQIRLLTDTIRARIADVLGVTVDVVDVTVASGRAVRNRGANGRRPDRSNP